MRWVRGPAWPWARGWRRLGAGDEGEERQGEEGDRSQEALLHLGWSRVSHTEPVRCTEPGEATGLHCCWPEELP